MNPSLKLIFALIISLEITFTTHLTGNLLIIFGALLVLAYHRVSPHKVTKLALITLIPAAALFVTMAFFSPGTTYSLPGSWSAGFTVMSSSAVQ